MSWLEQVVLTLILESLIWDRPKKLRGFGKSGKSKYTILWFARRFCLFACLMLFEQRSLWLTRSVLLVLLVMNS